MTEPLASCTPLPVMLPAARSPLFQLAAIILAGASANYALCTLGPLQETIRTAMGFTDNQMAMLQGPALYLPSMLVGLPLGFLIDRISRARLLAVFTGLEFLGTILTALAPNFGVLLVARVLIGSMLTANSMNASALVAEWTMPHRRGRALMMLGIGQIALMSAAFALGGKLVALGGADPDAWRWAMQGLAVPIGLVSLLSLWVRDPPQRGETRRRTLAWRSAAAALWRYRAMFLPLAFGQVVVALGYTAATVWSAPLLARRFHLSPDRSGALMGSVLLVSGVLGPLLGGTLADLCQRTGGPRRIISLMFILALAQVPMGFYGVMPGVLSVSVVLTGLCTICSMKGIISTAATSLVVPDELLGSAFGAWCAISSVFTSISPVAVSMLAGRIGGAAGIGQALTVVCVATSLMGAATFAAGRRYFPGKSG
jgi:MFS family permease